MTVFFKWVSAILTSGACMVIVGRASAGEHDGPDATGDGEQPPSAGCLHSQTGRHLRSKVLWRRTMVRHTAYDSCTLFLHGLGWFPFEQFQCAGLSIVSGRMKLRICGFSKFVLSPGHQRKLP